MGGGDTPLPRFDRIKPSKPFGYFFMDLPPDPVDFVILSPFFPCLIDKSANLFSDKKKFLEKNCCICTKKIVQ